MAAASDGRAETPRDFRSAVNMTPAALEKWLATGESRAVGITHGEARRRRASTRGGGMLPGATRAVAFPSCLL